MLLENNIGLFIINNKADVFKNVNYAATVSWKLCYQINSPNISRFGRCNFLTDGWFAPLYNDQIKVDTHEELVVWLNNNPYKDEYRLMTKEEVLYLIQNRNQGFI